MTGLYRLLLRAAPREFRERHGEELLRVHEERRADLDEGSRLARLAFEIRETAGMTKLVLRLRAGAGRGRADTGTGGGAMLERLGQDARLALRTLRRNPGYALAGVAILGVGIGANTAIFSAANAFLFRPLPFAEADRLVTMYETNPEFGWTHENPTEAAPANVLDWKERVEAFEDVAIYASFVDDVTWVRDGEPVLLGTVSVTGNFFDVLGARPALGRGFLPEETWAGRDDVVVLSHASWVRDFGRAPDVIGRTLDFGSTTVEIVGVMPPDFGFPSAEVAMWSPWGWEPEYREAVWFRRAHFVRPVARLADGVTLAAADAELQSVVSALQSEYPETNRVMGAGMLPLRDYLVHGVRSELWLLLGAGGLLLLLACVNVANLALVRAAERTREVALRHALGAGRGRVALTVAAESTVLALAGGVVGLGLGWLGVRAIGRLTELGIDGVTSVALDARVVGFTLAATLVSGLLFGVTPALRVARGDVQGDLRDGARSGARPGRHRGARLLVAAEVALALLLATGAGLMARTFWALRDVDPGFDPAGVVAVQLSAPSSRYAERSDVLAFQERLVASLEARPGVEAAGMVGHLPLDGTSWSSQLTAEGWGPDRAVLEVIHRRADAGYFETLRVPVVRGRSFGPQDRADSPPVVLVNETFARENFPGEDPVGRRVTYDRVASEESVWREIVGVVGDQHQVSPGVPARPEVFEHRSQDWSRTVWVVVRTDGLAMDALPTVQAVVRELDPLIPLEEVRSLREVWRTSMAREELVLTLLGAFAVLALLLAMVGVFAVTAQAARRRTREIGVRMALGAASDDVVRLMLTQGLGAVALGVGVGLAGSLLAGRALSSLLYGVEPSDPGTLGAVAALLLGTAALACWIPARRATRVDPSEALRGE